MRVLGGVLAVLFVVAAAYSGWALSQDGVVVNEAKVEIARPSAEVFPYLVEPQHVKRWLGGLVESRPVNAPGSYVGARSVEVIDVDGQRREMELEIVKLDPGRRLTVEVKSDYFIAENEYRISELDGGVALEYRSETRLAEPWLKLFAPVLRGQIQSKVEEDLAKLENLVERGVGAAPAN